jgi:type I restriction enzyme S subunit
VQGKLVPQDPNDEPASELLKRIEVEKAQQVKEGKIKRSKPLPPIAADDVPYDVPGGWQWVMISELMPEFQNGCSRRKSTDDGGIDTIVLRLADITNGKVSPENPRKIKLTDSEIKQYQLKEGDVLITRVNGSIDLVGSFIPVTGNEKFTYCDHFIRMRTDTSTVHIPYLTYAGRSLLLRDQIRKKFLTTAGQKTINQRHISTMIIPLPPRAEQSRIAAKVNQLMSLCNELEAQQAKAAEKRNRLVASAVDKLLSAADAEMFAARWQLVAEHFDLLFDTPEHVDTLRSAILQLAVQGKLVRQDPRDEPASALLKRIQVEKQRLVEEGKIKRSKPLPPIREGDVPYELPTGWEHTRLGDIALVLMGNSPPGATYTYERKGAPLINGPVEFGPNPFSETIINKFTTAPTKMCKKGDLLLCVRGSTGRTNIAGFDACIGRGVAAIQSLSYQGYLNWFILASRQKIYNLGTGSTFPSVSYDKIVNLPYPLPPTAEQKRIVAKVDQLMTLCDELEGRLKASQNAGETLMAAVVRQVTEPTHA